MKVTINSYDMIKVIRVIAGHEGHEGHEDIWLMVPNWH